MWLRGIVGDFVLDSVQAKRALRLLPLILGMAVLVYSSKTCNRSPMPVVIYSYQDSLDNTVYSTGAEQVKYTPRTTRSNVRSADSVEVELFEFDPNTLDADGFVRLGFSLKQAQVIINYRSAGAVFRDKGDFARCYTVSEWMFARLSPYIVISADLPEPKGDYLASAIDIEVVKDTLQAEAVAYARDTINFPIDINSSDSATLVEVRGIGPLTAGRIVEYREKLGGFVSKTQLSEVKGMTERNYYTILEEIYLDSCNIKKIDVNFATPKQMSVHPYISDKALAKIIKNRQLRGGWSTSEEFRKDNILNEDEFERLCPYMLFNAQQTQQ
ncbi:MAG: helix-hairpin-helix domain-containing protein [Rikenellaceae bacterium]